MYHQLGWKSSTPTLPVLVIDGQEKLIEIQRRASVRLWREARLSHKWTHAGFLSSREAAHSHPEPLVLRVPVSICVVITCVENRCEVCVKAINKCSLAVGAWLAFISAFLTWLTAVITGRASDARVSVDNSLAGIVSTKKKTCTIF